MRRHAVRLLSSFSLAMVSIASAEEPTDVELLQRAMGSRAIAFARIDLAKVETGQLVIPMAVGRILFKNPPTADPAMIVAAARSLHGAGPRYAYVVLASPAKVGFWPDQLTVVPAPDDAAAERIEQALQQLVTAHEATALKVRRLAGGVAVGGPTAQGWSDADRPDQGREIAAALAAAGDAPLVMALVPSSDQQRVLQELVPLAVPESQQHDPLLSAAAQSRWTIVALSSNPQQSLRVVLQYGSSKQAQAAATALAALWDREVPQGRGAELLPTRVESDQVRISADAQQLQDVTSSMAPEMQRLTSVSARRGAMSNLKQIGLALHNAASDRTPARQSSRFPDAAIRDAQGHPLLSWRVALLPYLGQNELYREFRLNEQWDSDHNKRLIPRMPAVYRIGPPALVNAGKTCVLLPIREETIFPAGQAAAFSEITDGLSNTILGVEANDQHAVTWTKPDDLVVDFENPQGALGGHFGAGFLALMGDGSVQYFEGLDAKQIQARFTRAGAEPLDPR
ncbi:MAG: DUF1559 domain-containing protein [Planctomycetaceae bacterium]|nr:DUF1559 domain-containing protein [Planctomycetaceae bacterium]